MFIACDEYFIDMDMFFSFEETWQSKRCKVYCIFVTTNYFSRLCLIGYMITCIHFTMKVRVHLSAAEVRCTR